MRIESFQAAHVGIRAFVDARNAGRLDQGHDGVVVAEVVDRRLVVCAADGEAVDLGVSGDGEAVAARG